MKAVIRMLTAPGTHAGVSMQKLACQHGKLIAPQGFRSGQRQKGLMGNVVLMVMRNEEAVTVT